MRRYSTQFSIKLTQIRLINKMNRKLNKIENTKKHCCLNSLFIIWQTVVRPSDLQRRRISVDGERAGKEKRSEVRKDQ